MVPLILLAGNSGVGKDTTASFLVKNHGAVTLAFADPIKRFTMELFDFSEQQLWGPSEERNKIDPRFTNADYVHYYHKAKTVLFDKFIEQLQPQAKPEDLDERLEYVLHFLLKDVKKDGGLAPRKALQYLATEWIREYDPNTFARYTVDVAHGLLSGNTRYFKSKGLDYVPCNQPPNWVVITDGRFRNEILTVSMYGGKVWKIELPSNNITDALRHVSESQLLDIPDHFFDEIIINYKQHGLKHLESKVTDLMHQYSGCRSF